MGAASYKQVSNMYANARVFRDAAQQIILAYRSYVFQRDSYTS